MSIVGALGGKSLQLLETKIGTANGSFDAGIGVAGIGVRTKVAANSEKSESFNLEATFDRSDVEPHEPRNLRWTKSERLWGAMISARLGHGLRTYRVNFSYVEDFGVSAETVAGFKSLGFHIGGEYHERRVIQQEYLVEFWPSDG